MLSKSVQSWVAGGRANAVKRSYALTAVLRLTAKLNSWCLGQLELSAGLKGLYVYDMCFVSAVHGKEQSYYYLEMREVSLSVRCSYP